MFLLVCLLFAEKGIHTHTHTGVFEEQSIPLGIMLKRYEADAVSEASENVDDWACNEGDRSVFFGMLNVNQFWAAGLLYTSILEVLLFIGRCRIRLKFLILMKQYDVGFELLLVVL